MTNMGTSNSPEGVEHFGHKAMLRKHLETGLDHRGGIWMVANEVNCRSCEGGIIPINLLEGVERIGEVEEHFQHGNYDFVPDFMIWGKNPRKPIAFVEIVHTSHPSPEKVEFCRKEGIDLLVFDARAPIRNHYQTRLLWGHTPALSCRRRYRSRLKQLMDDLYSLPADASRFGVCQQLAERPSAAPMRQMYRVGEKTVNASELTAVASMHLIMVQLEANHRETSSEVKHGDGMRYTPREREIESVLRDMVNTVQWENVKLGETPHAGKPADGGILSDVWFYPKSYWNAPEAPPFFGRPS